MSREINRDQDGIGLVLTGGGAKGAYQVGVWKAICEMGLKDRIRAVSGTSVGAINGAAFASVDDPMKIEEAWVNHIGDVVTPNFKALTPNSWIQVALNVCAGKSFPLKGLLDRSSLEQYIRNIMPSKWPATVPNVYATSLAVHGGIFGELNRSSYSRRCFRIDAESDNERRIKMILASAAIPWGFDPVELDGMRFVDGGWDDKGGENIPVTPILTERPDIRTLIVVRCNAKEVDRAKVNVPRNVRVVEIRPRIIPSGILDDITGIVPIPDAAKSWMAVFAFNRSFVRRYIQLGYQDGLMALRQLRSVSPLKW